MAKSTSTGGQSKRRFTVAEKRVIALETELTEVQDSQKQSIDAAKKFEKCATEAAAHLAESVQRTTKAEGEGKLATEKWADVNWQVMQSTETMEDALRRLTD